MITKTKENGATTGVEIVMPREGVPEVLRVHRRELPGLASGQVVVQVARRRASSSPRCRCSRVATSRSPSFPSCPATT